MEQKLKYLVKNLWTCVWAKMEAYLDFINAPFSTYPMQGM